MKTTIRPLLIAVIIYAVGVLLVATGVYLWGRQQDLMEADAKLKAAAETVPQMLAPDFHDRAIAKDSISTTEDRINMQELSRHAKMGGFAYLYTYIVVDDEVRFTSSNYDADDLVQGIESKYWTDYAEGPPEFVQAWRSGQVTYVTNTDRWGSFRTVLLPQTSATGKRYVVGADYDIAYIEMTLFKRALAVAVLGAVMLILALPLVFAYRRTANDMNHKLQELNAQLNDDIEHAHKVENELRAATQAATIASAAKSQFLANMTHELRTPLNGVLGMTELLLNTELNSLQREYVEVTRHSGEVLLDTINQILDFAAVESGHLPIRPAPTTMRALIEEMAKIFAPMLTQPPLDLVIHLDDSVPPQLWIDHNRLRQVLINLIGNALKFTHAGGVDVTLSWRNGELLGTVEDTGVGVPRESQDRIFEAFQQVDNSNTRRYGGTGLGLPLARALCRAMQGDLWLERSSSLGSIFAFRIQAPSLSTTAANDERLSFAGRVVIFSEFRPNAAWLAQRFNHSGVQCRIARHIDEAEAEVMSADLLILDANVGVDAVKRLQARAPAECQLIWLSCVGQKAPEGAVVLHKPVTLSALQQALMHVRSVVNTPFKRETVVASAHHNDNQNSKTFSNRKPILIVEDNQVNRIALLHMLKSLGYDADAASSGAEALTLLQQQHYELVLMDIQMADMDGLETTRRIKELMESTAPKIIAVSAHVFPEDIRLTRDAGMIDFVGKPIRRDDLQRILKQYLL